MNYMPNQSSMPRQMTRRDRSMGPVDRTARFLGWFSLGLGVAELVAPGRLTRALGMQGYEPLVRAYGAREVAAGIGALSVNPAPAIWSRIAGDALDIGTLALGLGRDNPKRGNVGIALAAVLGVTVIDALTAPALQARHRSKKEPVRDYSNRSGLPKGIEASRGIAAQNPPDYRAAPVSAASSEVTGETGPQPSL